MKTTQPYEFLIRFGLDGAVTGAHVQWREVFTEGDEVIMERPTPPVPVAIGVADGFPLQEVLDGTLISALATNDALAAALAEKNAAVETLSAELATRDASIVALTRRVAELEAASAADEQTAGEPTEA